MEIIVKKDILDELQAKGICHKKEEAENLLGNVINELSQNIIDGNKVNLEGFATFFLSEIKNKEDAKIIQADEFIEKIAKLSSFDKDRTDMAINMLSHFFKDMLIKGFEVHLIDFASFRIEEKKAQIVKSPRTGQRTVMPARKTLVFEPEKNSVKKQIIKRFKLSLIITLENKLSV